jgi:hypothetical protein
MDRRRKPAARDVEFFLRETTSQGRATARHRYASPIRKSEKQQFPNRRTGRGGSQPGEAARLDAPGAAAMSVQARAAFAELRATYDRCRADAERQLRDRFVPDPFEPGGEGGEGEAGVVVDRDGAGEDLRSILADCFDWPMQRAFCACRKAMGALK